jgi:hypothetical protein
MALLGAILIPSCRIASPSTSRSSSGKRRPGLHRQEQIRIKSDRCLHLCDARSDPLEAYRNFPDLRAPRRDRHSSVGSQYSWAEVSVLLCVELSGGDGSEQTRRLGATNTARVSKVASRPSVLTKNLASQNTEARSVH